MKRFKIGDWLIIDAIAVVLLVAFLWVLWGVVQ